MDYSIGKKQKPKIEKEPLKVVVLKPKIDMSLKDPLKYWSEKELENFYGAIRKHGLDYEKIKDSVGKNKTDQ